MTSRLQGRGGIKDFVTTDIKPYLKTLRWGEKFSKYDACCIISSSFIDKYKRFFRFQYTDNAIFFYVFMRVILFRSKAYGLFLILDFNLENFN